MQCNEAFAAVLNLSEEAQIAQRELITLSKKLNLSSQQQFHLNGISQGNTVYVKVTHQYHTQLFTALGEMRKSAEQIADHLAKDVNLYLSSQAVVDEYLADQLLLPLALGQGGEFTAQCISEHTRTQAAMIEKFIDCEVEFVELNPHHFHVKLKFKKLTIELLICKNYSTDAKAVTSSFQHFSTVSTLTRSPGACAP